MLPAKRYTTVTRTIYQPDIFDRKRIERSLASRSRYKYVTPAVRVVEGGFKIESPCCSRTVDADGGVIDIAMLLRDGPLQWRLYSRDHAERKWLLHSKYKDLSQALEQLNSDPKQKFWQ